MGRLRWIIAALVLATACGGGKAEEAASLQCGLATVTGTVEEVDEVFYAPDLTVVLADGSTLDTARSKPRCTSCSGPSGDRIVRTSYLCSKRSRLTRKIRSHSSPSVGHHGPTAERPSRRMVSVRSNQVGGYDENATVWQALGVSGTPTTLTFAPDGQVIAGWSGERGETFMREQIDILIANGWAKSRR